MDEYTVHNYTAIDRQINQIARRERARTFAFWLQSLMLMFGYGALTVFLIVILALGLAWAYKIATTTEPEKIIEVVRPEIIERESVKVVEVPVERIIVDPGAAKLRQADESNPNQTTVAGKSSSEVDQASPSKSTEKLDVPEEYSSSIVTNYTTFNTVSTEEFKTWKIYEVVSGWRYDESDQKFPSTQYCYASKQASRLSTTRIDLANIAEEEFNSFVSDELARDVSVPKKILLKLQKECIWAEAQ